MFLFFLAAVGILWKGMNLQSPNPLIIVVVMMILILVAILGVMLMLVKLWEQHRNSTELHLETHQILGKQIKKNAAKSIKTVSATTKAAKTATTKKSTKTKSRSTRSKKK